jgi:hypothetical protein
MADDPQTHRMRTFLDVAEVHQFDYLRSAAEDVLYA